ncbi:MAG: twin-arginine translocation signal domain-containing protein, partial [Sulfurimicrobium sp.]|nr:twin-arginine translocation signal domain-containing protein [Sulfurimicrobium sp.]
MSEDFKSSRRDFMKKSATLLGAGALMAMVDPAIR